VLQLEAFDIVQFDVLIVRPSQKVGEIAFDEVTFRFVKLFVATRSQRTSQLEHDDNNNDNDNTKPSAGQKSTIKGLKLWTLTFYVTS
jgi:hypothetical protein